MAISYVGQVTATAPSGVSSYDVELNGTLTGGSTASPISGDVVVVTCGIASTSNIDFDLSAQGYTELVDAYSDDTNDANLYVGYKIMGENPDSSVTLPHTGNTADGGSAVIQVWRGVDLTTPIDQTSVTATGINGNNVNPGSITPVTPGALVISAGVGTSDTTPTAKTLPATMETKFQAQAMSAGTSRSAITVVYTSTRTTQIAYDPPAISGGETSTNDSWAAGTIALRPADSSPYVVAVGSTYSGTTSVQNVAWPTHQTDDLGLLIIESQTGAVTLNTAHGFTLVTSAVTATGTILQVYACRATYSNMPAPQVAGASDHQISFILTVRGASPGDFNAIQTAVKNTSSTTTVLPSVTTVDDNCLVLSILTSSADSASAFASNYNNPNLYGMLEQYDGGTTSGNGGGIAVLSGLMPLSGEVGTTSVTVSNSTSAMMVLAIKPDGLAPLAPELYTENNIIFTDGSAELDFSATDPENNDLTYEVAVYPYEPSTSTPGVATLTTPFDFSINDGYGSIGDGVSLGNNKFLMWWGERLPTPSTSTYTYARVFELDPVTGEITPFGATATVYAGSIAVIGTEGYYGSSNNDIVKVYLFHNHVSSVGIQMKTLSVTLSTGAISVGTSTVTTSTYLNAGRTYAQLDDTHLAVMNSLSGSLNIIEINPTNNTASIVGSGYSPDLPLNDICLVAVNQTKFLAFYRGTDNDGYAILFSVNPSTYNISVQTLQTEVHDNSTVYRSTGIRVKEDNNFIYIALLDADAFWGQDFFIPIKINKSDWTITANGSPVAIYQSSDDINGNKNPIARGGYVIASYGGASPDHTRIGLMLYDDMTNSVSRPIVGSLPIVDTTKYRPCALIPVDQGVIAVWIESSTTTPTYSGVMYSQFFQMEIPTVQYLSARDAGFSNLTNPSNTDPFNSGDEIRLTITGDIE